MGTKKTFILCKDRQSYVSELSLEDKAILLEAMFNFHNGLDPGELSYGVKICFSHMRKFWEEQNKNYEEKVLSRNRENGKKGGRPPQKKPKKPSGLNNNPTKPNVTQPNPTEPNVTLTDTDILSVSNDTDTTSNEVVDTSKDYISILKYNTGTGQIEESIVKFPNYGEEEINQILAMISVNNDGAMDGTKGENRQFAKHLLGKLREVETVKSEKTSRQAVLAIILGVMRDDQYHSSKLSSPKKIHQNFGTLISESRKKFALKKTDFKSF